MPLLQALVSREDPLATSIECTDAFRRVLMRAPSSCRSTQKNRCGGPSANVVWKIEAAVSPQCQSSGARNDVVTAVTARHIAKATSECRRLVRPFFAAKEWRSRARHARRASRGRPDHRKDPRPIFSKWMNASSVRKGLPKRELTGCAQVWGSGGRWRIAIAQCHRSMVPGVHRVDRFRHLPAGLGLVKGFQWAGFVVRMWREQLHASARSLRAAMRRRAKAAACRR